MIIQEKNEKIAKFMNLPLSRKLPKFATDEWVDVPFKYWKFNEDWNLLMDVVEKIESLGAIVEIWLSLGKGCRIYFLKERNEFIHESNSTIEAVYEAVYQFIEWYDKNKKL